MKICTTALVNFTIVFLGFTWKCICVHQSCTDSMDAIAAIDVEDKWEIKPFPFVLGRINLKNGECQDIKA